MRCSELGAGESGPDGGRWQLFADRRDDDDYRQQLRARRITSRIAHLGVTHGSALSKQRLGVERCFGLAASVQTAPHWR